VNATQKTSLAALGLFLVAISGCKGNDEAAEKAAAEKKALEAALPEIGKSVALISAYLPYTGDPGAKEKYATKRRNDMQRATEQAANEIRHTANGGRQRIDVGGSAATKELAAAFAAVSTACTDANEQAKLDGCNAKVKALDEALGKFEAACSAAGISAKVPRVGPAAITDEAKKAIAPYVKARGPGKAEAEFFAKCADEKATIAAVIEACKAAASETEQISNAYEKADEPIRVLSATHHMSVNSQCNALAATETVQKEVLECKKKPTAPECKTSCGKAKTILDDGIPAAAFASMAKEYAEICEKIK
jgi:uncharacterized protein YukE